MPTFHLSRLAEQDLFEIALYIANRDGVDATRRFFDEIDARFARLAENSQMGRLRPEIGPGLRSFPLGDYLIFYRSAADGVIIERFLHGARDIAAGRT